jgi:CRP-like cAMP-binding protein
VYDRFKPPHDNVVGLLYVKDLILLDPNEGLPIAAILSLFPRSIESVFPDVSLKDLLQMFTETGSHLAVVHDVINDESESPPPPALLAHGSAAAESADSSDANGAAASANGSSGSSSVTAAAAPTKSRDPFYQTLGLVSLEDVLEEILATDIVDENEMPHARRQRERLARKLGLRKRQLNRLSPQEHSIILHHLLTAVDLFRSRNPVLSASGLKAVIADSLVIDVNVRPGDLTHFGFSSDSANATPNSESAFGTDSEQGHSLPSKSQTAPVLSAAELYVEQGGRVLYKRGHPSDFFTLILEGEVEIRAGADGFVSQARKWNALAVAALQPHPAELASNAMPIPADVESAAGAAAVPASSSTLSAIASLAAERTERVAGHLRRTPSMQLLVTNRFSFVADFSAVATTSSRLLRIDRKRFVNEVRKERNLPPLYDNELRAVRSASFTTFLSEAMDVRAITAFSVAPPAGTAAGATAAAAAATSTPQATPPVEARSLSSSGSKLTRNREDSQPESDY